MNDHGHSPAEIRARLAQRKHPNYFGDFVLGAIDGCVTTFAIVAGVAGSGLSTMTALILGVANLVADGFSMAVGNFQKARSDQDFLQKIEAHERRHIEQFPDGEREEIRQIFRAKGFSGEMLEKIVATITDDPARWVRTMVVEEYGLSTEQRSPWYTALVTFAAFVVVGLVPLLPFVFAVSSPASPLFVWSAVATGAAFFGVGALKGRLLQKQVLLTGLETLLFGGVAAALAYGIGYVIG